MTAKEIIQYMESLHDEEQRRVLMGVFKTAPGEYGYGDEFLLGEVRYLSVKKAYPNEAEELFAEAQKMAQLRYKTYVRKTQEDWTE